MQTNEATAVANQIYSGYSMDYTARIHYAMNEAGKWFWRCQNRTPWGYRWCAWRSGSQPERLVPEGRKARLPK